MPRLNDQHMKVLARYGAQARINELKAEISEILHAFPDIDRSNPRAAGVRSRLAGNGNDKAKAASPEPRRNTKQWSPAARKAAAQRMKKYWADRRAKQAAKRPAVVAKSK